QIIELASGAVVATAPALTPASIKISVDLASDGRHAVVVSRGGMLLWWERGRTGWLGVPIQMSLSDGVRLSPGGRRVALVDNLGRLEVREPVSGRHHLLADTSIQQARFVD